MDIVFRLLDHIDKCLDEVISSRTNPAPDRLEDWAKVLPAWCKVLLATAESAQFKKKFRLRGAIHSFADGRITDNGPLTRKRIETLDEGGQRPGAGINERANKANKPLGCTFPL